MHPSRPLLVLVALVALPAAAQPSGVAVMRTWLAATRAAMDDLATVQVTEENRREIDGPAGTQRIRTVTALSVAPPDAVTADLEVAEIDGRRVLPLRLGLLERRLRQAYGPGYVWTSRPQPLVRTLLSGMRPAGAAVPEPVRGSPALRVALVPIRADGPVLGGTAWFAPGPRGSAPRLLRVEVEGRMPAGGSAVVTTDYVHVEGLDLPLRSRSDVVLRQRRRLRDYTVLLSGETTYRDHSVTWR